MVGFFHCPDGRVASCLYLHCCLHEETCQVRHRGITHYFCSPYLAREGLKELELQDLERELEGRETIDDP